MAVLHSIKQGDCVSRLLQHLLHPLPDDRLLHLLAAHRHLTLLSAPLPPQRQPHVRVYSQDARRTRRLPAFLLLFPLLLLPLLLLPLLLALFLVLALFVGARSALGLGGGALAGFEQIHAGVLHLQLLGEFGDGLGTFAFVLSGVLVDVGLLGEELRLDELVDNCLELQRTC